jgi:hypothetical protein
LGSHNARVRRSFDTDVSRRRFPDFESCGPEDYLSLSPRRKHRRNVTTEKDFRFTVISHQPIRVHKMPEPHCDSYRQALDRSQISRCASETPASDRRDSHSVDAQNRSPGRRYIDHTCPESVAAIASSPRHGPRHHSARGSNSTSDESSPHAGSHRHRMGIDNRPHTCIPPNPPVPLLPQPPSVARIPSGRDVPTSPTRDRDFLHSIAPLPLAPDATPARCPPGCPPELRRGASAAEAIQRIGPRAPARPAAPTPRRGLWDRLLGCIGASAAAGE